MATLIESLLGAFVYCSLLIVISSGMMPLALPECDKLFNDLHACDSLDKVKEILDTVPNKDHSTTMVGSVSVDAIVKFSDTECNLDKLAEKHFIGPKSYCKEGSMRKKNAGVEVFVKHYSTERMKSCENEMVRRLSLILEQNTSDKEIVERFYRDFRKATSDSSTPNAGAQIVSGQSDSSFSSCIGLIKSLQGLIPCSAKNRVYLEHEFIKEWYKIMDFCIAQVSFLCVTKQKGSAHCASVRECLSGGNLIPQHMSRRQS